MNLIMRKGVVRVNSNLKNIFLIGPSRAGKTTFEKKLGKMGYNHVVMDAVIETMNECYPELGIKHGQLETEEFKTFLTSYWKNHFKYGLPYIIDLEVLDPQFASEIINTDESTAIYLGYPRLTPEEKLIQIRKYDTKFDWTINESDNDLLEIFKTNIDKSKKLQEEAPRYGYKFLDVSYDRENVFKDFIEEYTKEGSTYFHRNDESYNRYER